MRPLDVMRLTDVYGWAYHFIAMEQKKYSYHTVNCLRAVELVRQIEETPMDVLYIPCPIVGEQNLIANITAFAQSRGVKVMGAYSGEVSNMYKVNPDIIISISLKFLHTLKRKYPKQHVIYLPEAADTEFFKPKYPRNADQFVVGWAGRPDPIKRHHLLNSFKYPILRAQKWGREHFVQSRTLDPMLSFYQNLDAFILISKSECMPRVVLEAMACGLPVVATDVGSLSLLLPKDMLVPNNHDTDIIKNVNRILDVLRKDNKLRIEIGRRNRERVEKYFSWKYVQLLWDLVWSAIASGDSAKVDSLCKSYMLSIGSPESLRL